MSWYQPHLATSLEWILESVSSRESSIARTSIIDVGGGASTLVDDLFATGFRSITILDIASSAIVHSQQRMGTHADSLNWIVGDVTSVALPPAAFDVWYDRAVFHFLTVPHDRAAYARQLASALKPSGHAIIATFSVNGPQSCSGLPVQRHSPESLQHELGPEFQLLKSAAVTHTTPSGSAQEFLYCRFARAASAR
jgi:2-polyprenyl-3-methyl-5-hydroxy-6-metoxy-1,4-benzoquinol methylase